MNREEVRRIRSIEYPSQTESADGNDRVYHKERPEDLNRMIPKYTQRYNKMKKLFTLLGVPDVLAQTKENEVQQSKNRPHVESGRSEANALNKYPSQTESADGNDRVYHKERPEDLNRMIPKYTQRYNKMKKLFTLLGVPDVLAQTKENEVQQSKNRPHVESGRSEANALNKYPSQTESADGNDRVYHKERPEDLNRMIPKYTQRYNKMKKLFTLLGVPDVLAQTKDSEVQQRKDQPHVESGKREENALNKHHSLTKFADGNDKKYQKERPEDLDRVIPRHTQRYNNIKKLFTVLGVPDVLAQTKDSEAPQRKNQPHVASETSEENTTNIPPRFSKSSSGNDRMRQKERSEELDRITPHYTKRYNNMKKLLSNVGFRNATAQTKVLDDNVWDFQLWENLPLAESESSEESVINNHTLTVFF